MYFCGFKEKYHKMYKWIVKHVIWMVKRLKLIWFLTFDVIIYFLNIRYVVSFKIKVWNASRLKFIFLNVKFMKVGASKNNI
jgi:hypothetical protein